jgi:hypothetical protein
MVSHRCAVRPGRAIGRGANRSTIMVVAVAAAAAHGQSTWSPPASGVVPPEHGTVAGPSCGPDAITCSQSLLVDPNGSVACNAPGQITRENHYFRHFIMANHGAPDAYQVGCVTIGVSRAQAGPNAGGVQPATLNLYDVPEGAFPAPPLLLPLIATLDLAIEDQIGTHIEVPILAKGTSGGLVVELMIPDAASSGANHTFFFGANSQPQACLSYISAADCGIIVPVPTSAIGFPGTRWVMSVGLVDACQGDTDGDGDVDVVDLVHVILDWNTDGSALGGDVDGDGTVALSDLMLVASNIGLC